MPGYLVSAPPVSRPAAYYFILGLYRENGKEDGTTVVYRGYIGTMKKRMETIMVYLGYVGMMEKRMETTIVFWGYMGIMEKKMETTIVYWGYIRVLLKHQCKGCFPKLGLWFFAGGPLDLKFPKP